MVMKFHYLTSAALIAGALVTSSPSTAQETRPWVDPPSENGSSPSASGPSSNPSPVETKPAAPVAPPATATIDPGTDKPSAQQAAETVEKPAAKPASKKAVFERKTRKPTSEANASNRTSRKRTAASNSGPSRQSTRLSREERVRRGLDSGLELMTLRTIEYPDGRRVQILTRPSPGVMSELLEERR
jgi:hypothetical protein